MEFPSINIQGNIISSEILNRIRNEDIKYQQAKDFKLTGKNTVRDEIGVAWAAIRAHWTAFRIRKERLSDDESGVTITRNSWIGPFLQELGYSLEYRSSAEMINVKSYHISHKASNINGFPIHVLGINDDLDKRKKNGGPRLSAHALMQEYLNNTEHTYALVSNGRYLRLLRDATRLVRLSYLEFDLEKMMEEELYADFAILFRLLHATRMPQHPEDVEHSFIEYYHQESLASGSRIREELSEAVEKSIKLLANGFLRHPENAGLRVAVRNGALKAEQFYLFLLRLIYRFLFLIVTEERNLIYPNTKEEDTQRKKKLYYEYYSIERLRRLALRLHYVNGRKHDLWEGLKTTFLLFEREAFGGKLGIKPLGSGLFSPTALGILPSQKLDNQTLLSVVRSLTLFENEQKHLVRVNYSDLDVEEFGSVYEGLLEYDAVFNEVNGQPEFSFVKGKGRSSSGSHYTPEELVKSLIKYSLDYIIEDKLKEKDKEQALLSIKVCDVACGSGHILLSAARRIATPLACHRESIDSRSDVHQPSPPYFRKAVRDVIRNCIYGVDKNPLAVELCKVALWLESHNPGEPLGFLDHHIKCGDAIVGLAHREELENGIPDEAFKTLPEDDKRTATALRNQNKSERKERKAAVMQLQAEFDTSVNSSVQEAIVEYGNFMKFPETTPDEIEAKQCAYQKFLNGKGYKFLKTMADAQVAQFFIAKTVENKNNLMTDAEFQQVLRGYKGWQLQKSSYAFAIAHEKKIFHWFTEFPEVFQQGGFDCVLGNPPFLGGQKLSGTFGNSYLEYIKYAHNPIGAVDLVTYFFRRIFNILKPGGFQSLISTNTIAQGAAREGGLDIICSQGGVINHAVRSMRWPGQAAVEVSLVTIHNGQWNGDIILDNKKVERITPYLDDSEVIGNPFPLKQNEGKSFQGSILTGTGFILTNEEAEALIMKDLRNKDVLFPYLNGDDLNNNPDQKASRWVINFFDWPEEKARTYPDCFEILEQRVKTERRRWKVDENGKEIVGIYALRKPLPERWWIYEKRRAALYRTISKLDQVMVIAQVSKTLAFTFVPSNQVISMMCVVLAFDDYFTFALLQSTIHQAWVQRYASALKADTRYTPSDVFETFPFPHQIAENHCKKIIDLGKVYFEARESVLRTAQLGLTKFYNLFHNQNLKSIALQNSNIEDRVSEKEYGKEILWLKKHLQNINYFYQLDHIVGQIEALRILHAEIDNMILGAYGWEDIGLDHDFHELEHLPENDRTRFTIHPNARREILVRLLLLNHEYHNKEIPKVGKIEKETCKKSEFGLFSESDTDY